MRGPVQTGIAAYGLSGRVFHAPFLHANPGFELTAVVERSRDTVHERYPHTMRLTSFDELIAQPAIELVVVNTPDVTHYEFCHAALEAGKHVVVEKPFVFTLAEAETLIALAKARGLLLTVYQNRRFDGDFRTVQQVIRSGVLGRIVEFNSAFQRYRNFIVEGSWKERADRRVGMTCNLGSHSLDQALVLFGMPDAVWADIEILRDGGQVDDYFNITLYYPRLRANLKAGYLMRGEGPRFTLHGTAGSCMFYGIDPQEKALGAGAMPDGEGWGSYPPSHRGVLTTDAGENEYRILNGNYMLYYDNLYNVIRQSAQPEVNHAQMLGLIRLLEACFESSESGRVVDL